VLISNCSFDQNTAVGSAGAVQTYAGAPIFTNSIFTGNSSGSEGGSMVIAVNFSLGADVGISGCTISGNSAVHGGGGIMVIGDNFDVLISDTEICSNLPDDIAGPWTDQGGVSFCDCIGDVDGSGTVNGADLSMLLGSWGVCGEGVDCETDFDGNGVVDGADLSLLLGNWGLCGG